MEDTPTRQTTASASPFFFIGNALALDLVNTDVILRRRRRDLLPTPEAVGRWWAEACLHHPGSDLAGATPDERWQSAELFEAIKELRTALRTLFDAVTSGQQVTATEVAPLNRILPLGYQRLELSPRGEIIPAHGIHGEGMEALLLPIALSAFHLLTEGDRERLRACENGHCVALFYDTSKSATRRWCSEGCMNRARSAQRYAHVRAAQMRA